MEHLLRLLLRYTIFGAFGAGAAVSAPAERTRECTVLAQSVGPVRRRPFNAVAGFVLFPPQPRWWVNSSFWCWRACTYTGGTDMRTRRWCFGMQFPRFPAS